MAEATGYTPVISSEVTPLREAYEDAEAVSLTKNLDGHNDENDGFTLVEPGSYDFQRLDCIAVHGKNATAEEIRSLASVVYPATEQVIERFAARKDLLNHAASLLLNGKELAMMTDHYKSVIGIAVAGGAFLCALYENTPVRPEDIEANLFASYFVKYTKLQGAFPTSEVLAGIFSQTTYTLPPSPSVRDVVPKTVRDDVNKASMAQFLSHGENLSEPPKGRFTMFAGSGSRDVTISSMNHTEDTKRFIPKVTHMGPLAFGTADITMRIPTMAVGIDISSGKPRCFIGEIPPTPFDKTFEADAAMTTIAQQMSRTGHPRIYHPSRHTFYQAIGKNLGQ